MLSPEPLEAGRCGACVSDGVSDVPMAEVILNEPRVVLVIGQIVAGGVAQHVGMDVETELGAFASLLDEVVDCLSSHRAAFAEEEIRRGGISPLLTLSQPDTQRPQFVAFD